jgi:uncharacterized protein (DUF302 family)
MAMETAQAYVGERSPVGVEETIDRITKALAARGFGVLWHLDINEKLVEKGLEPTAPFHVLEVCSAPRAREALTIHQRVGYFLPCKVVVFEDRATHIVEIGFERPTLMVDLLQEPALKPLADEVEGILGEALREAAGLAPA